MSDVATTPAPRPGFGRRRLRTLLVGLGVVFGLLFVIGLVPRVRQHFALQGAVDAAAQTALRVPVAKPHPAAAIQLQLPGTTLPFQQTTLYSRANGYLDHRLVDIGDRVKTGQLLAVISAPDLDQQVAQARGTLAQGYANRAQQKANLDYARTSVKRYEDANHDGAVAQQDLDQRRNDVLTAEAVLKLADATIEANLATLRQLTELQRFERVTAPFDGVITQRNVDAGALITAGASANTTPLFTIAQDDVLRVYVNVPQPFVDQIKAGQAVKITTRTLPDRHFDATVARKSDALDPASRTMVTEVDVPNGDGLLKPGMYVQVELSGERVGTRWRIPASALFFDASGMQVMTVDPEKHTVKRVPVVLGYDYGSEVEVFSGLNGDEVLVTSPSAALAEGTVVEAVERK